MVVDVAPRAIESFADIERRLAPKTYLGYYMPFAGVKYYAVFDEDDIAEGRHRIGPVGWRLPTPPTRDKSRIPVAA